MNEIKSEAVCGICVYFRTFAPEMKRLWLLLLLTALLMGCEHSRTDSAEVLSGTAAKAAAQLCDHDRDSRHRPEAMLSDATNLYRLCNTRPQRLMPSHVAKQERTQGKTPGVGILKCRTSKTRFFDGRVRTETSPFCVVVSRDYYVIALRRILR